LILLNYTIKLEDKFEDKMLNISTNDIFSISNNVVSSIAVQLEKTQSPVQTILSDTFIQKNLEEKLKTLLTNNIKYTYLLYKDKNEFLNR
jgi:hypothetical protein